jgi:hypothetical protein
LQAAFKLVVSRGDQCWKVDLRSVLMLSFFLFV